MKTGMLGAEAAFAALARKDARTTSLPTYRGAWRKSWVYEDLYKVRNVKPGLQVGHVARHACTAACTCG